MSRRDVGETKSGPIESYKGLLVRFCNKKIECTKLILTPLILTIILLSICSISSGGPALSEEIEIEIESAAVLTLQDAVSMAIAENPEIENASLEVSKAANDIAAAKTKLLPEFDFSVYELYHLTEEAFTFKKGEFGDFPSTGPIPPENVKIRTAPNFTTYLTASVGQPLSQLYEISLLVKQRRLERDLFDQELRATRQEIADRVKKKYYDILKTQSGLRAKGEKIVFLKSLSELVDRNVKVQRALESDSLM